MQGLGRGGVCCLCTVVTGTALAFPLVVFCSEGCVPASCNKKVHNKC